MLGHLRSQSSSEPSLRARGLWFWRSTTELSHYPQFEDLACDSAYVIDHFVKKTSKIFLNYVPMSNVMVRLSDICQHLDPVQPSEKLAYQSCPANCVNFVCIEPGRILH